MSETTPGPVADVAPALPSTADTAPYVPVSWLAVTGAASAGLFAILLLVMGLVAFRGRRPLLDEELLVLGVAAVVLSFAARRVIRNSEGTRTGVLFGIDLPNAAWWTGLVLGLGYATYLFAIDFSIRQDAKGEVQRWVGLIQKNELAPAFHRTRDPNERSNIPPNAEDRLESRWGNDFISFRQSDLVRLISRNPEPGCQVVVGGLRRWEASPTGIDCVVSVTVTCPEGVFPAHIPLRAVELGARSEAAPGRQWQVVHTSGGYVQNGQIRITPYGWLLRKLEVTGGEYGRQFISTCTRGRDGRLAAYLDFAAGHSDPILRPLTTAGAAARSAVLGVTAARTWAAPPAFDDYTADRLFSQPGGEPPTPEQVKAFRAAWGSTGVFPSGSRLQNNPDQTDQLRVTGRTVELRVPLEIPLPSAKNEIAAARGRVVLVCTTPGVADELDRLRASADPEHGTNSLPDDLRQRTFSWKVVRIESDMKKVTTQLAGAPPGVGAGMPGAQ